MPNLRYKLLIPTLMMALMAVLSVIYISVLQHESFQRLIEQKTSNYTQDLKDIIEDIQKDTHHSIELLSNKWHFMDSIASKNMEVLLNELSPLYKRLPHDFIAVYDTEGIVIARGDAPEQFGMTDGLYPHIRKAAKGNAVRTLAMLYDNKLLLLELKRLDAGYGPIGFFAVGQYLDEKVVNHYLQPRQASLALQYGDDVVVSSSNFQFSETKDQNRFRIEFSDKFGQNSPLSAILCIDVSTISWKFWYNLFSVTFLMVLISCALILFSRRSIIKTVSALNEARVSAEKELIKRRRIQNELKQLNNQLEDRVRERTQNLEDEIVTRKQAEKALRESEENLRITLNSIGDAVIGTDIKGRITIINPMAANLTGWAPEEAQGKPMRKVFNIVNAQTKEPALNPVHQVLESGEIVGLANHTMLIAKDGTEHQIADSAAPIRDGYGNITGVVLIFRDVTEAYRMREKLKESEIKYRSMMESIRDPIYICSTDYQIEYMNPAMVKRVGHAAKGEKCFKILHGFNQKCPWCKHGIVRQNESFEKEIVSPKDNRSYLISQFPFFHMNKPVSRMTICRDTTAFKKMESQLRQAQKMEAIGTLAGGIAHDFNNILFPIFGYMEMALEDLPEKSPLHSNIEKVFNGAQRARDLVQQILAFSRQTEYKKKPLRVQIVIKEVLKLIRSSLPATITIYKNISNECEPVMADPTQVHQIAMNLITNAYHAMEETGGMLSVTLKEVELTTEDLKDPTMESGPCVCLTVADTGIGMDQVTVARIFDPYFTTKEEGKGTGLGLAVIHGIVKSHGGHISVYSEPGKGTEFKVYLPVIQTQTETADVKTDSPIQKGNERILLVDDDDAIIQMEKQMLERLGYQVTSRTSSIEALNTFQAQPYKFDLVVTDLTMPNMTGAKLAREMINIRPDIPAVLCTGFSEIMSKEKAASLGFKGFLMKPILLKDLSDQIRRAMDKQ